MDNTFKPTTNAPATLKRMELQFWTVMYKILESRATNKIFLLGSRAFSGYKPLPLFTKAIFWSISGLATGIFTGWAIALWN